MKIERAFGDDVTESPVLTLPIVSRTMIAWRGKPPQRVVAITVLSDTGEFRPLSGNPLPTERPAILALPALGVMFERAGDPWFAVDGGARSTRQYPPLPTMCPVCR